MPCRRVRLWDDASACYVDQFWGAIAADDSDEIAFDPYDAMPTGGPHDDNVISDSWTHPSDLPLIDRRHL